MQVRSFITIIPPEPIIDPASVRESKSTFMSRRLAGRQPPEGPPVCTALNSLPSGIPPPTSSMISRKVIPMGTSTRPVLRISPTKEKTLVPEEPFQGFSLTSPLPMEANHWAPFWIITGILAQVSTLFNIVGLSRYPYSTL